MRRRGAVARPALSAADLAAAPGVAVAHGGAARHERGDGTATVTPVEGRNQLLAIIRMPVTGDAKTTQRSYEYLFAFQTHD